MSSRCPHQTSSVAAPGFGILKPNDLGAEILMSSISFVEPSGQGLLQFAELGLALVLSGLIGLEREIRQKSAGLRTYTLVGLASALIILISKYGFTDILADGRVVLDPSRIATDCLGHRLYRLRRHLRSQGPCSGPHDSDHDMGDFGGRHGLRRRPAVAGDRRDRRQFRRRLRLSELPKSRWMPSSLQVSYQDGRGVLRDILTVCTQQDFAVTGLRVERDGEPGQDRRGKQSGKSRAREAAFATAAILEPNDDALVTPKGTVSVVLELRGGRSVDDLDTRLNGFG
jgi:putative Mg2+ transporter-C (MgtC) family protein